jgi:hypothetical protein
MAKPIISYSTAPKGDVQYQDMTACIHKIMKGKSNHGNVYWLTLNWNGENIQGKPESFKQHKIFQARIMS